MNISYQKYVHLSVVAVGFAFMTITANADDFSNILNNVNQVLQQTNEAMQNSQQRDAGVNNPQNQGNYPQPQGNYPPQPAYNPPPTTPASGNQAYDPERYENSAQVLFEGKCHNKSTWQEESCTSETIRLSQQPKVNKPKPYPYIDHKLDPPGTTCGWIIEKGHNIKICQNGAGETVVSEDHGWHKNNPGAAPPKFKSCEERINASRFYNETDSKGNTIAKVFYDDQGVVGRYHYDKYGRVLNGHSKCPQ